MTTESYEKILETLGIEDITENLGDITTEQLAERIRICDEWIPELVEELCYRADMLDEWREADPDDSEELIYAAAEKLGVEI